MSRQHVVHWTCDRCGARETRPSKSDANVPGGWTTIGQGVTGTRDLCDTCSQLWGSMYASFFSGFMTKHPQVEQFITGLETEDALLEMDPEVNDEPE